MLDHLAALWKEAPAVTRLVVTVPLVLHFAGLRWYRELDHLKLSLDAFKNKGLFGAKFETILF